MLIVTRLKLSNICQYDELDIPITTGLMAVCGRNGSGKSTLLRGLMYGLTGLVDGSWGTQASLQKDGVAVPGYVVVTLRDDRSGKEYIIKRYAVAGAKFADSVTEFENGNYKEVATRRKTVDAYMSELYGIPVQLLFQLCWGRQGQLDLLLTAPAAYVSTFLSGVFNTKYLEVLRDKLKIAIDGIAAYDDLSSAIQTTKNEQAQLEAWIAEQQSKVDAINEKLTPLYDRHKLLSQQMGELSTDGIQKTAALQATKASLQKQIATYDAEISKPEYDKYRGSSSVDVINIIDNIAEEISLLEDEENHHLVLIDSEQEAKQKCLLELKDVENKLSSLTETLNTVVEAKQKLADSVFHDGTDTCILCGHPVDEKSDYVKQLLWLVGYEGVEAEEIWDAPFNKRIADLQQQLDDLQNDKREIEKAIQNADKVTRLLRQKLQTTRDKYEADRADFTRLQTIQAWLKLTSQIAELEVALKKADNTAVYDAVKKQFDDLCYEIQVGEDSKHILENEIIKANAQITAKLEHITKLSIIHEQAEVNNSARSMLMLLRDVFSQQRAQARYLASKSDELNARLASFLETTGMPFNLYLDKDQRVFKYTSEGGFEHPTAHLSGAQKNISAVALQMALVEVISPNINLFLFDEPSESLDTENKIVMAELFKRMNRLLPSIGGTMLIVSRDEPLIEACENVINIQQATKETDSET